MLHKSVSNSAENFDSTFSDVHRKVPTGDGGDVISMSSLAIIPSVQWALG